MQGWLKIKAASEYSNTKERTFRSWLKDGLRHSRINGTLYFKVEWINHFMQAHEVINNNKVEVDQIVDEVTKELL